MIKGLPPGTILQFIFIRRRLMEIFKGKNMNFIDVGSGNGHLSNLLLLNGHQGIGVDLNDSACVNNEFLNKGFILDSKYSVFNEDFSNIDLNNFDFLISSMVIEHINDENMKDYMKKAKSIIKSKGKLIFLVPSNKSAWGIEDDIAGHIKRYDFNEIEKLAQINGLKVDYKCGLTYPMSNWLLKLSNFIVKKNESHMQSSTEKEKTVYTGNRNVKYKTTFPSYLNIVLNDIFLLPFHWIQRINKKNEKSLVMYFELSIIN